MLTKCGKEFTAVLIVPSDKAMLIFMKGGNLEQMDSHERGVNGAIIATSFNICNFVDYLSGMVHQYWNATLSGSHFP